MNHSNRFRRRLPCVAASARGTLVGLVRFAENERLYAKRADECAAIRMDED